MKSYLDLVKISAKVRKKQNRMSVFCIFLAAFLVMTIFGMADMFIRSQFLQTQMDDGTWHVAFKYISNEEAALISARPEIKNFACYGVFNYGLDMGYTLEGKELVVCGSDESYLMEMAVDAISEGSFPQNNQEILVCEYAKTVLGLKIGDSISICAPDGNKYSYVVSGFSKNAARAARSDAYFVFLTTEAFRSIFPGVTQGEAHDYDSLYMVQFYNHRTIHRTIADIKTQFDLSDEQIVENAKMLALLGQSGNAFIMQIYLVALILSILVLMAGILMIASSMNSNVAGRIEFFGMLRCIGATPKQIMRLVRREALGLCRIALPVSLSAGVLVIWILCAILRYLSPQYFTALPVFGISFPSVAAGICISILTVLLAARSPAKRASRVSPLTAVCGNANDLRPVRKAANTALFKIDTALGIHHAKASPKNFLLVASSFALSIILFLSFTVTLDFMKHALVALYPWSAHISVSTTDNSCSLDNALLETLQQNPVVKKAYARMYAYNIPLSVNGKEDTITLVSYDETQFGWAKKYLLNGDLQDVQTRKDTGLLVYTPQYEADSVLQTGDIATLYINGKPSEIEIAGMVSNSPVKAATDTKILICSENTFRGLTGENGYTIIDLQLTGKATEQDVNEIHKMIGERYTFSDMRLDISSSTGAYYSFGLFIYGFLVLIALITIFNIMNCVAMNVAARMKQYGALRAIGLSNRQLVKMIVAEAVSYALTGCICGGLLGIAMNKILFQKLITFHWGSSWSLPFMELSIIIMIVIVSVILAVWNPVKKIHRMLIVDTISAQ